MGSRSTGSHVHCDPPSRKVHPMKLLHKILALLSFAAGGILAVAAMLFFRYNAPIIQYLSLLAGLAGVLILGILALSVGEFFAPRCTLASSRWFGLPLLLLAGLLVFVFLESAVVDYFQPFSLYDNVIYLTLAAFLLLILRFIIQAVTLFTGRGLERSSWLLAGATLALLATIWSWSLLQPDFTYQNIRGEPQSIFPGGEGGYAIYRIPSLLIIPAGAQLADATVLEDDLVLAFAEARRSGSLDDGDVDLVLKRSVDGGGTWSPLIVVRQWDDGVGKIGNATPVYDAASGKVFLFHIAGARPPYTTWIMESADGGQTFGAAVEHGTGIVGPGHGIQATSGRLLIPAHDGGVSFVWISTDHGVTWRAGQSAGAGNESQLAQAADGKLVMTIRTTSPVAKPHPPLHQLIAYSTDEGETWTPAQPNEDLRTSICMTSLVEEDGRLFFSHPNDFYSRARLTVAVSSDGGQTFSLKLLIYAGPAGYSDLGVLSNGDLLLLFENGAVEYDERLTLVRIPQP